MTMILCNYEPEPHLWDRPPQRGRPPKYCPNHQPVEPVRITTPRPKPAKKPSLEQLVPGISEALEATNTETLWCEHENGHEWERKSGRGRKPRFCPEHLPHGQIIRKEELTQEHKEKAREKILGMIQTLSARVESAALVDENAWQELERERRANLPPDNDIFNKWLKMNGRLLNEVTALRAQENKLNNI